MKREIDIERTFLTDQIRHLGSLQRDGVHKRRDAVLVVAAHHDIGTGLDQKARRVDVVVEEGADQGRDAVLLVAHLDSGLGLDQQLQAYAHAHWSITAATQNDDGADNVHGSSRYGQRQQHSGAAVVFRHVMVQRR